MRGGPTPDACDGGKARSLPRLGMEVARLPFIHGITVYLPDLCDESSSFGINFNILFGTACSFASHG